MHCKTELQSSRNVCELSCNEVTLVSFCGQDEVMPSRSKTIWKELLQDMMLIVHASVPYQRTSHYRLNV